jgi:hypothetical protein
MTRDKLSTWMPGLVFVYSYETTDVHCFFFLEKLDEGKSFEKIRWGVKRPVSVAGLTITVFQLL